MPEAEHDGGSPAGVVDLRTIDLGIADDDQFLALVDPSWQPATEGEKPGSEAIVGGWYVRAAGRVGRFLPNPGYRPSRPDSPTDPVDAAIQYVIREQLNGDDVVDVLGDVVLGVALDESGAAVVTPAPDGVPCVLAATAPAHRDRVNAAGWAELTVGELALALEEDGVDVLINPGAPFSLRMLADAVRRAAAISEHDTEDGS